MRANSKGKWQKAKVQKKGMKMRHIKTNLIACLFVSFFFLMGCTKPTLVEQMRSRGVTHLNTEKIVIRGGGGDVGSDTFVEVDDVDFIIQRIWDTIYASRPYCRWSASGDREIEFYNSIEDTKPRLTLMVNASDLARIEGQTYDEGFRCPGLSEYLQGFLKEEYEKKHLPPLFQAAYSGEPDRVKQLISEGADVRAKDPDGLTALHVAAMRGHQATSEALLDGGADINARDDLGRTAADLALINGHEGTAKFLREKASK